jgi:hypothetical protein
VFHSERDYAIDIVHENVQLTPRDEYDRDIKILLKVKRQTTKSLADLELDDKAYDTLKDTDADLTEKELAEMKLYVYRKTYMVPTEKIRQRLSTKLVEAISRMKSIAEQTLIQLQIRWKTKKYLQKMDALVPGTTTWTCTRKLITMDFY